MNLGLFAALAGWLLPVTLLVRFAGGLVVDRRPALHPLTLWRAAMVLVLIVPIMTTTPLMVMLLSGVPTRAADAVLAFAGSRWGLVRNLLTIPAVLFVDWAKPRIAARLDADGPNAPRTAPSHLARDVGVVLVCLALACAATWRLA